MAEKLLIENARIISPGVDRPGSVLIAGGKIEAVLNQNAALPRDAETVDAAGGMLLPGFIDVHCHGKAGADFSDPEPGSLEKVAKAKVAEGVTSVFATTLTLPESDLASTCAQAKEYARHRTGAKVPGIHLEGPFINPKCLGAQNPDFVREPDASLVGRLNAIYPVKRISYAPECGNGPEFAAQMIAAGIVPSGAHTAAKFQEFKAAYDRGLRHMTHFCNQMTPLHHRDIGMVGAGLLLSDTVTELICDLIHVSAPMVKLIFQVKDCDHVMLISDAMRAAGMPDGSYTLGGLPVTVQNGAARLSSNGALAGSTLAICDALKNVASVTGLPLSELVKTTSFNAAREHKLEGLGKIEPGYTADLVLLSDEFKVRQVFIDGTRCL
ncbi:MAG: N-acetylglucosamine-6-phosphate deacetylase [Lentisphaeria bacterium]|nr:N-acetylglucosamine-6-phosphate deacetylase [Lentisphaeria bacterium]